MQARGEGQEEGFGQGDLSKVSQSTSVLFATARPCPLPAVLKLGRNVPRWKRGQTWGEPDPHLFHGTRKHFGWHVSMDIPPPPAGCGDQRHSSAPASVNVHRKATCRGTSGTGSAVASEEASAAEQEWNPVSLPAQAHPASSLSVCTCVHERHTQRQGMGEVCVCVHVRVHIHAHMHVHTLTCAQRKPLPGKSKQEAHESLSVLYSPMTLLNK